MSDQSASEQDRLEKFEEWFAEEGWDEQHRDVFLQAWEAGYEKGYNAGYIECSLFG